MSYTTSSNGRLGNQIFRNIAISLVAKKFDLNVTYCSQDLFQNLGINLYSGTKKYSNTKKITDDNYLEIFQRNTDIDFNLNSDRDYFQTKYISNLIYNYLNSDENKESIIKANLYKDLYNNNEDVFMHIRLGDVIRHNPGIDYYINALREIFNEKKNIKKLFIASDSLNHELIKQITNFVNSNYNINVYQVNKNEVNTIMFASTCKYIILSHGTFSAVIGYMSFFSKIYYPKIKIIWHGDIFSINGWNEINY